MDSRLASPFLSRSSSFATVIPRCFALSFNNTSNPSAYECDSPWPNDGRAAYYTGQKLNGACSVEDFFSKGLCSGYIMGVYDAGKSIPGPGTNRRQWDSDGVACVPEEVLVGQLVEVVKKWLREHPEGWHFSADSQVSAALDETWPCP